MLELIVDELKIVFEVLGNEDDVFKKSKGELMDIVDEVIGGNNTLGCRGNLGINGSVDELVGEFMNDVIAYRDESLAGIIVVCN